MNYAEKMAKLILEATLPGALGDGADGWFRLQARAGRGSIEKLQQVLSKVSEAPAEAIDRL